MNSLLIPRAVRTICSFFIEFSRSKKNRILLLYATFSVISLISIALSLYRLVESDQGCRMSYMHPYYIRQVNMENDSWTKYYRKYALYLYREGGIEFNDEAYRIPVLFIPGNAGSFKQVRSLARASAEFHAELLKDNPALLKNGTLGLDYFTVDLNEELTALHGRSMIEQAEFVNNAIAYILSLYDSNRTKYLNIPGIDSFPKVESIIIIGHSMGGMVARTALTLPNYAQDSVKTIITLSTPHSFPTANLDSKVSDIYSIVNKVWSGFNSNAELKDLVTVSIVGGDMDAMINSDLAYVNDLLPEKTGFTIMTSSIRGVWLSMDHQSILWCRQFVQSLARALVDIVDARFSSQTKPVDERLEILRQRFFSGSLGLEAKDMNSVIGVKAPQYVSSIYQSPNSKKEVNPAYYSILHSGNHFRLSSTAKKYSNENPQIHLLDNTRNVDGKQENKNKKLQVFISSAATDSVRELEHLHLICCNPYVNHVDFNAGLSKESRFVVSSSSNLKLSCTWFPGIRTAALMGGKRGHHSEAQFVELQPSRFSHCSKIGLLEPTISSELRRHTGQIRGKVVDLRLTGLETAQDISLKPSIGALLFRQYSVVIQKPALSSRISEYDNIHSIRTRIVMDVAEDPFLEYKFKITSAEKNEPSSNIWTPLCIRQSDARGFENRYWARTNEARVVIHGRGAYTLYRNPKSVNSKWDGIYLDIFSLKVPQGGLNVSIRISLSSSLARIINRYHTSIVTLLFFWSLIAFTLQLYSWYYQGSHEITREAKPKLPSDQRKSSAHLETQKATVRNEIVQFRSSLEVLFQVGSNIKFLAGVLLFTALFMYFQLLAMYAIDQESFPDLHRFVQNLFFGYRGSSLYSPLVPMLLVVVSLGVTIILAFVIQAIGQVLSVVFSRLIQWRLNKEYKDYLTTLNRTEGTTSLGDNRKCPLSIELKTFIWNNDSFNTHLNLILRNKQAKSNQFYRPQEYLRMIQGESREDSLSGSKQKCEDVAAELSVEPPPGFFSIIVDTRKILSVVTICLFVKYVAPYHLVFMFLVLAQTLTLVRAFCFLHFIEWLKVTVNRKSHQCDTCSNILRLYRSRVHYISAIFLLWLPLVAFCVPEVVAWIKNVNIGWIDSESPSHRLGQIVLFLVFKIFSSNLMPPTINLRGNGNRNANQKASETDNGSTNAATCQSTKANYYGTFSNSQSFLSTLFSVRNVSRVVIAVFLFAIWYILLIGFAYPYVLYDLTNLINFALVVFYICSYKLDFLLNFFSPKTYNLLLGSSYFNNLHRLLGKDPTDISSDCGYTSNSNHNSSNFKVSASHPPNLIKLDRLTVQPQMSSIESSPELTSGISQSQQQAFKGTIGSFAAPSINTRSPRISKKFS